MFQSKHTLSVPLYLPCQCCSQEPEEPDDEEEKARQKALNRKAAALAAKNPETPASRTFADKTDPRMVTTLCPIAIYYPPCIPIHLSSIRTYSPLCPVSLYYHPITLILIVFISFSR